MIDRILFNGNICTLDPKQPRVSALALSYGRIVACGSDDDVLNLAGASTVKENLNGQFVIPGFVDAHIHWELTARALQIVDLYEVPSKAEALKRIAAGAEKAGADDWIQGRGWTQDYWEDNNFQFPNAAELDAITGNRPAYFGAKSGHAAWVNSAALRLSGIDANTPDPEGGEILRDADGNPTGILLETAMMPVKNVIPDPTPDQLADFMHHAQNLAMASGLTGLHDFDNPSCLRALQILRERGDLGLRVVKQVNQAFFEAALESGIRGNFGDEWLRIGGLKLFADGALGPRTAYMVDHYEGQPENFGIPVVDKEDMRELVSRASAAGLPSTIHAIGDRSVHEVLDVYEAVRKEEASRGETPSQRRHRIEHVQIVHPQDIDRLAELDVIASMQPSHATSDWRFAMQAWGEERCKLAYNPRIQIDKGARVAFGSDAPVERFEPLEGIYAAVTRQTLKGEPEGGWFPESCLTMQEALEGFTIGNAYAAGLEDQLGQLKAGYLADLVVLDKDLFEIEPAEILETGVVATMSGGKWRHGGIS